MDAAEECEALTSRIMATLGVLNAGLEDVGHSVAAIDKMASLPRSAGDDQEKPLKSTGGASAAGGGDGSSFSSADVARLVLELLEDSSGDGPVSREMLQRLDASDVTQLRMSGFGSPLGARGGRATAGAPAVDEADAPPPPPPPGDGESDGEGEPAPPRPLTPLEVDCSSGWDQPPDLGAVDAAETAELVPDDIPMLIEPISEEQFDALAAAAAERYTGKKDLLRLKRGAVYEKALAEARAAAQDAALQLPPADVLDRELLEPEELRFIMERDPSIQLAQAGASRAARMEAMEADDAAARRRRLLLLSRADKQRRQRRRISAAVAAGGRAPAGSAAVTADDIMEGQRAFWPSPHNANELQQPASFTAMRLHVVYEAGRTGFAEDKDLEPHPNSVLAGRFLIREELGSAAFSSAFSAIDLAHDSEVCLKVVKNNKEFFDQSLDELKLLRYVNGRASSFATQAAARGVPEGKVVEEADDDALDVDDIVGVGAEVVEAARRDGNEELAAAAEQDRRAIRWSAAELVRGWRLHGDPRDVLLEMSDYFYYKEHLVIVTELLKDNLYEFQKFVMEEQLEPYFTMGRVQRIAQQTLRALAFIHSQGILHCDLKPENILIQSISRCNVKVIDFGSSCFATDKLTSYIQSRSYRAPEVILGLPYGPKIDTWSLGCILCELLTGKVLFTNDSVPWILARIQSVLGRFPQHMLDAGTETPNFFMASGEVFEQHRDDDGEVQFAVLRPVPASLAAHLDLPEDDPEFIDFVKRMLAVDPNERLTAEDALRHPWFQKEYPTEAYVLP